MSDHGHGHGDGDKNGDLPKKLGKIAVTVLVVMVFLYVMGALIPSAIDAGGGLMHSVMNGFSRFMNTMKSDIRYFGFEMRGFFMEVLQTFVVPAAFIWLLYSLFAKKKDDGHGHGDGHGGGHH